MQEQDSLSLLSEYGELFSKYPVLLKVYYIQKSAGAEELNIPELAPADLFEQQPEQQGSE